MEFKQLDIKPQGNWIKRFTQSQHIRKTSIYIAIGAVVRFFIYYITDGIKMDTMPTNEIIRSIFTGAFFGFFITNSPCARNKC